MRDVLRRAALAAVRVLLQGVEGALRDGDGDEDESDRWARAQIAADDAMQTARRGVQLAGEANAAAQRALDVGLAADGALVRWLRGGVAAVEATPRGASTHIGAWHIAAPTVDEARAMLARLDEARGGDDEGSDGA